ncbi:chloride channel protein, partial [Haematococcus lacustris]
VKEITEALRGVTHNGFPVVKDSASGQVVVGLITRSHLMALLQRIVLEGRSEGLQVGWSELNRRMMDPVLAQRSVHEQQMVALQREMANSIALAGVGGGLSGASRECGPAGSRGSAAGVASGDIDEMSVDLLPYTNTSSFVAHLLGHQPGYEPDLPSVPGVQVPDSFSVERTYILFRTMGLRHLMVIDQHNHVRGIVTRKDLLGFRLGDIDEMSVDLLPYTNTSSFVVPDSFSVERTYILFRTMGLRHLMVIDQHNHVRGIVTRKDLLGFRLGV